MISIVTLSIKTIINLQYSAELTMSLSPLEWSPAMWYQLHSLTASAPEEVMEFLLTFNNYY